jgi:hypothetical protein
MNNFNIYNDKDLYIIESTTNTAINFMDNLNNDLQWQDLICSNEETIHITTNKNTLNSFIEYLTINNISFTNFDGFDNFSLIK